MVVLYAWALNTERGARTVVPLDHLVLQPGRGQLRVLRRVNNIA
jgi:hypothetical protein